MEINANIQERPDQVRVRHQYEDGQGAHAAAISRWNFWFRRGPLPNMTTFDNSPASQLSLDSVGRNTSDIWLLLGRIALGSIFVVSGFGKLTHLRRFRSEPCHERRSATLAGGISGRAG